MGKQRYIEFNVEDFAPKKGERFFYALMIIVFLLVIGLIGYITLVTITPYKPYEWYSYTPAKEVVCPNESVEVYVDRYIDPEANVESVEVNGYWTDAESGRRVGDVSAYVSRDNSGPKLLASAFKTAPSEEGDWYPTGYTVVEGKLYGWPVSQSVEHIGDRAITVEDGEDC